MFYSWANMTYFDRQWGWGPPIETINDAMRGILCRERDGKDRYNWSMGLARYHALEVTVIVIEFNYFIVTVYIRFFVVLVWTAYGLQHNGSNLYWKAIGIR